MGDFLRHVPLILLQVTQRVQHCNVITHTWWWWLWWFATRKRNWRLCIAKLEIGYQWLTTVNFRDLSCQALLSETDQVPELNGLPPKLLHYMLSADETTWVQADTRW